MSNDAPTNDSDNGSSHPSGGLQAAAPDHAASDNQPGDASNASKVSAPTPATRYCSVYVTTGSLEEARAIGSLLVRERLAACANIFPKMTSVYWWDDDVQTDTETVLILKTRTDHLELLSERVRASHSYDCPCVVAWPIVGGNPDYLDWIAAETTASASRSSSR